jgi:hypothetical protein
LIAEQNYEIRVRAREFPVKIETLCAANEGTSAFREFNKAADMLRDSPRERGKTAWWKIW